jgi:predicted RNA-binding Zn ribbon-like protein
MRRAIADPGFKYETGAPWLDLLATVGGAYGPDPVERMRGLPQLVEWLDHQHLSPQTPPVEADVAASRELRELIRPLVVATLADEPVPAVAVAALQPWLDNGTAPRPVVVDGRIALAAPPTARAALGSLARQAVEFLADPGHIRLGACADEDCHMAFLDPAGKRRWCVSGVCGVRARVRKHRARTLHGDDA